MLFTLANDKKVFINDLNEDLINVYTCIKQDVELLIRELKNYEYKNTKDNYYKIREEYNNLNTNQYKVYDIIRGAQFIYLNRTAYGGLYRVNMKGEYNAPYWNKPQSKKFLPENKNLELISEYLKHHASISSGDFIKSLDKCEKNDFIYLDPPYCDNKIQYNKIKFDWNDQLRIKSKVDILHNNGCYWMITNKDKNEIRELFKDYRIKNIKSDLKIDSKQETKFSNKEKYREIVITNYDIN